MLIALLGFARAQSFNVDLEGGVGGPDVGAGTPSSAFGAAASNSGFWNGISANGPAAPATLFDLQGQTTGVSVWATGGFGSAGGFNNALRSEERRVGKERRSRW